jgi:integrase
MARKVRDKQLDTREARSKLTPRGKPYWRAIEAGLHVGYRRLKGRAGTWWVRHYLKNRRYETKGIGAADDLSDADGRAVLSFWQAQSKAREIMVDRAHAADGATGPCTVSQAMEDYLVDLGTHRKSEADARSRFNAFIRDQLGHILVDALTTKQIRAWHIALANRPARIRTKKGEKQRHRELGTDSESVRRRKSSANRTLATLRSALNRAWREGEARSDTAWRRVKPFKETTAARGRYLQTVEAQRLINASDLDFRILVQAALMTGARYGELARLKVADFNHDSGTLAVLRSKSGKSRHIELTDEGVQFFEQLCAGRAGDELMLRHPDGSAWSKSQQCPRMKEACTRAKIAPISFHGLRHTWTSLAIMNKTPLMVVARNLGHRDTRMLEQHYAHLAESYVRAAIKDGAPKFGFEPTNVTAIR